MCASDDKIEIENFTSSNWRGRVDRAKYEASMDQWLGRMHEPHNQGRDRKTLPLR